MADIDIFRDTFVPNIQGFSKLSYNTWKSQNPAEAAKWEAYRDTILVGQASTAPVMNTKFGKALVAAGQLVQQVVTPPPTTGTPLDQISDFRGWGHLHVDKISEVPTQQGPGLRFICDFPSGSGDGVQLVDVDHLVPWSSWEGFVFDLSGYLTIPSAGNPQGFPDWGDWNCLGEFGFTGQNSFVANQFGIDGRSGYDPTVYARTLNTNKDGYEKFPASVRASYDKATPFRWQLKFSRSSDGFARFWWDGVKIMDVTRPTAGSSWSNPYLHLGFYSGNVVRNEVIYSGLVLA